MRQALKDLLEKKNWTQEDLAARLGVSRYSVSQLMNGRRGLTPEMAVRLELVSDQDALTWLEIWAYEAVRKARKKIYNLGLR